MKIQQWVMAAALCAASAAALADDDCGVPLHEWQPRDAVLQAAAQRGWQVQRLKIDDGCYEIRGRDAQGRAFKARLDPRTLQPLKMKLRGRDEHDGEHEQGRERKHRPGDAAVAAKAGRSASGAASGAPSTLAPVTPGTTPRATIE